MFEVYCDGLIADPMGRGPRVPTLEDAKARVALHAGITIAADFQRSVEGSPERLRIAEHEHRRYTDPTFWDYVEGPGGWTIALYGRSYVIRGL